MSRARDEHGAALVMIIGVIAALAILATTAVALTANASWNTSKDRQRAQAFNVAEAAVDYALYRLGASWPTPTGQPMSLSPADEAMFLARFPSSQFPSVDVTIVWFDNADNNMDGVIDVNDEVPQDMNGDGYIFIEAQATVGTKRARIQVEAKQVKFDTEIPRGVALVADGDVTANNKKGPVNADPANGGYMAPDQSRIRALSGGDFINKNPNGTVCQNPPVVAESYVTPEPPNTTVTDSILSPLIIRGIIGAAKARGSYYTSQPPEANMEGLVVIQTTEQIEFKSVYNGDGVSWPSAAAPKPPGFMLVIGPDGSPSGGIKVQGNAKFYGILYTDGGMFGNGGTWVVGMLLAKGVQGVDLAGNREVAYNDNAVVGALNMVTLNAQIVPNTWREIQPK